MGKRRAVILLGTIIVVLSSLETQARAQDVDPKASAAGFAILAVLVFALIMFGYALFKVRKTHVRNIEQIDRSLQMSEEGLKLAREGTALQAETNRLLRELIDKPRQD